MLPTCLLLATHDGCLGRFDASSLDQQTLMELVVQNTKHLPRSLRSKDRAFTNIHGWPGVKFDTNDDATEIRWTHWHFGKIERLEFQFFPFTLRVLEMNRLSELHGTLDTSHLPRNLTFLSIVNTKLSGSIDCVTLPPDLRTIELNQNHFGGTLSWAGLPRFLTTMNISSNAFEGSVQLPKLPKSFRKLSADRNSFTGTLCLEQLPQSIKVIGLSHNRLHGSLSLAGLPAGLTSLLLQKNSLTGSISLDSLPQSLKVLNVKENRLSGQLLLQGLPDSILKIDLSGNPLEGTIHLEEQSYYRVDVENTGITVVTE